MRQLQSLSGHSISKLKRIKNHWLKQQPYESFDYTQYRYLIYDGTYFHKNGCFITLMNVQDQRIIAHTYAPKEGFKSTYPWFQSLRQKGLYPLCITMDGEKSVLRTIDIVWPEMKIQRCLYHIQREGLRWLRTFPKTQAGVELRILLKKLSAIKSVKDRDLFFDLYQQWYSAHRKFVQSLPSTTIAFKDLKKTVRLINNALSNMFHYLKDRSIPSTTNKLESFHSRLKADYRRHRGLTEQHKINYLSWYCYFKNRANRSTL